MTITAKFPSSCSVCGGQIRPGDKIEWTKGSPARHTKCPSESGSGAWSKGETSPVRSGRPAGGTPPRKPRAPRKERTQQAGEITVYRRSSGRGDTYQVGSVLHMAKIDGGGGGDGHWFVVVHTWFQRANEDNGDYDDMAGAFVRPATDDEIAPVAAERRKKAARATCESTLAAALVHDATGVVHETDTGNLPPAEATEISVVLGRKVSPHTGTLTDGGTTYALTATTVVAYHGGYYDAYRSSTRTAPRTEQLALIIRALAASDIDTLAVLADQIPQAVES